MADPSYMGCPGLISIAPCVGMPGMGRRLPQDWMHRASRAQVGHGHLLWYTVSKSGTKIPMSIWTIDIQDYEQSKPTADESWQVYMSLASQEGCILPSSDRGLLLGMDKMTLEDAVDCPGLSKDDSNSDGCDNFFRNHTFVLKELKHGNLVAVAQIATFRLGQRGSSHYGVAIIDSAYRVAGELCGEITHFREEAMASINKDVQYEFVALSLSGLHVRPYTGEERETKNYRDGNGALLDNLPIVNVLLIERKGEVVHRKELGWIYLKDWTKAERCWKSIVLG